MIATGRSDEKLAHVKVFGADHMINTSPRDGEAGVPKFRDEVKALTGGGGVEVVFDTVGGEVSQESMRSLAFGGRMVIVGWAGNTRVAQGVVSASAWRYPAIAGTSRASRTGRLTAAASSANNASAINIHV